MNRFLLVGYILLLMLLCFLSPPPVMAQQYQGPENGSVSGGAAVSTDNFGSQLLMGPLEPQSPKRHFRKHKFQLQDDPENMVQPTGPVGSNEYYDSSIKTQVSNAPRKLSGFIGIRDIGTNIPPDPHMAAGPDHVMGTVNTQFGIFDKSGAVLKLIDADEWYASVAPGSDPFDPQIVYDHHAERWIMIWVEYTENPPVSNLLLSISDDSNPLGSWCNWRLSGSQVGSTMTTFFNDYPKIGIDANAVYITANMYDIVGGGYQYSMIRIIPKNQLLNGECGPVTWTDLWDMRDPENSRVNMVTLIPSVAFGNPGTYYLICDSPYTTGTFMTLWHLIDPIGTPVLLGINVPVTESYGWPSEADQLGGSTQLINVGGRNVRNAVYMDGSLWTAHSVPGGTDGEYAFARYVRIDVNLSTAIEDVAYGVDGFWYYYPAIHPDLNGNMAMVFTRSGFSEFASARYTGRLSTDPPGLQASVLLKSGEANYVKTYGGNRNRWGDYLGIALDPVDGSKIWMFGQYAAFPINTWGTWFGEVTFTPVAGKKARFEPDAYIFDTYEVGQTSDAFPVTVSNVGADDLTITSISNSSSSFEISNIPNLPLSLSSFEEFVLDVRFTPDTPGALTDSIRIVSNDTYSASPTVPLSGYALGFAEFSGEVKDSLTNSPVKATLTFIRHGETDPRAVITTDVAGAYSAEILEGTYDITIVPEIPYPEVRKTNFIHSLDGTVQDLLLLPAPIVLIEDDSTGMAGDIYRDILDDLDYTYAVWNINEQGVAFPAERLQLLADPAVLFWSTGVTSKDVLSPTDRAIIIEHLNNGNRLILTGDNIVETVPADDNLLTGYLGVEFEANNASLLMKGFTDDPIGNGLITGATGEFKDQLKLKPNPNASVKKIFHYGITAADTANIAAVRVEHDIAGWKAAVFGFRLEEVTQRNRAIIIDRTLTWLGATQVGVSRETVAQIPGAYRLEQNYPNPFNPTTTISYELPRESFITLKVYNLVGQEIVTLVNKKQPTGRYSILFDASNFPNGVYMYQMQADGFVDTKKLILIK